MKKIVTILFTVFFILNVYANTTERAVLVFEGKRSKNLMIQNLKRTKGAFEVKSGRMEATLLSKSLSIPLSSPTPFIAFSTSIDGDFNLSQLSFSISVSNDNKKWSKWDELPYNTHAEKADRRYITQLIYLDKKVKFIKFRLHIKPSQDEGTKSTVKNIKLNFFSPGDDESYNSAEDEFQDTQTDSRASCSCSQPTATARTSWGASLGLGVGISIPPATYTTVTHLVVHHEAGSNSSTNWAARVRSIWDFHVNTNGWQDIGYNYLVDPNGVLYVGRGGGDNVQGAHFTCNANTMGVCLLGDYTSVSPTSSAINKLTELLAWKSCQMDILPTGTSFHQASGIQLSNICGHRDNAPASSCNTGTACPGNTFYPQLSSLRTSVSNYINTACSGGSIAPLNDNCNDAIQLTSNTSCSNTSGTVADATADNFPQQASCDNASPSLGAGVFYKFTAVAQSHTITVSPTGTLDAVIVVYSGNCNSLNQVPGGCFDQSGGNGLVTTLTVNNLTVGQQYTIRVYDYGAANATSGGFNICVTHTPCTYSISPSSQNFSATSSSGSFSINTGSGCTWTATSNCNWLTTSSSGSGNGTVNFNLTANTGSQRTCNITVSGQTFTVTQDATPCNYSINPSSQNFTSSANSGSFSVSAGSGCSWTASSNCNWLTTSSSGSGNGTINFNLTENTGSQRTCNITVGGLTFTVMQEGPTPCTYTLSPSSANYSATTLNGSFNISTSPSSCTWTASTNCSWITLVNSTSTGNGNITFTMSSNSNQADRTCEISVNGQPFTVNQSGTGTPVLNADFYASQTSGCAPLTIDFFDNSTGSPQTYVWEFLGNGVNPNTSTVKNPTAITYNQTGVYPVKLTIVGGGNSDVEVKTEYINVGCVGLDDNLDSNPITIFPNPSNGSFNVNFETSSSLPTIIKVFSLIGQLISEQKIINQSRKVTATFNLNHASKGVYLLQVIEGDNLTSQKIEIQ